MNPSMENMRYKNMKQNKIFQTIGNQANRIFYVSEDKIGIPAGENFQLKFPIFLLCGLLFQKSEAMNSKLLQLYNKISRRRRTGNLFG